jgi:hypothetical protein
MHELARVIDLSNDKAAARSEAFKLLTTAEINEVVRFRKTPAGQLFYQLSDRKPVMHRAIVQKLLDQAVRECGPPPKS